MTTRVFLAGSRVDDLGYREVNPFDRDGWTYPDSDISPITCPGCGSTMLEVIRRQYQTSVRCPGCKVRFVVHDG